MGPAGNPGETCESFFSIFGYRLCIKASPAITRDWIRPIYGTFAIERIAAPPVVLELTPRNRGWVIRQNGLFLSAQWELAGAVEALEVTVSLGVMNYRSDWGYVHGATLFREDGALLIAGPSGVGKSTLSLALWAQGWNLGSDDLAFLLPSGELLPLPRSVSLEESSRDLLARTLGPAVAAREILTPADFGIPVTQPLPVKRIVYLKGGPPEGELRQVSPDEMLMLLSGAAGKCGASWPDSVPALTQLTAGAVCSTLTRGGLAGMVALLTA